MSLGFLKTLSTKCVNKSLYLIYMYKEDLISNKLKWVICHKTKPNQTKLRKESKYYLSNNDNQSRKRKTIISKRGVEQLIIKKRVDFTHVTSLCNFHERLVNIEVFLLTFFKDQGVQPYDSTDTVTAWKNSRFIISERFDFLMVVNFSIAVRTLSLCLLTVLSVDEILLQRYMNWCTHIEGFPSSAIFIKIVTMNVRQKQQQRIFGNHEESYWKWATLGKMQINSFPVVNLSSRLQFWFWFVGRFRIH